MSASPSRPLSPGESGTNGADSDAQQRQGRRCRYPLATARRSAAVESLTGLKRPPGLPEREVRARSAVCRRVSPCCHWLWGSSHSFLSSTWCSASSRSESAKQRSRDAGSLSASAGEETHHQRPRQQRHGDRGSRNCGAFAPALEMSQEITCNLGNVDVLNVTKTLRCCSEL